MTTIAIIILFVISIFLLAETCRQGKLLNEMFEDTEEHDAYIEGRLGRLEVWGEQLENWGKDVEDEIENVHNVLDRQNRLAKTLGYEFKTEHTSGWVKTKK